MHTNVYPAPPETSKEQAPEQPIGNDYKQMETALSAYQFGAIDFLELLNIFERILNVPPDQAKLK